MQEVGVVQVLPTGNVQPGRAVEPRQAESINPMPTSVRAGNRDNAVLLGSIAGKRYQFNLIVRERDWWLCVEFLNECKSHRFCVYVM